MTTKRNGQAGNDGGTAGFSLVEVTLALLVVAVGMTAAFSLFPEGIQSTRAAVNNTETALFADYVFATLELVVGLKGDVDYDQLDKFRSKMFDRYADNKNFLIRDGKTQTFYWMPDFFGLDGMDEMAESNFDGKLKTAAFTYKLTLDDVPSRGSPSALYAVLRVLPGEYGDDIDWNDPDTTKNMRMFYREILPVQ